MLGPNGAGKSTLLARGRGPDAVVRGAGSGSAGSRSTTPSSGTFVEAAQRPVGFVFQDYRLFPHLSVLDNVAFSPRVRGLGRAPSRAVAVEWLERLGLADLARRRPGDLSGGQAQRVALGRALAGDPALLLLDEPLSALDARTRLDVQTELKRHLAELRRALPARHARPAGGARARRPAARARARAGRAGGHAGRGRPAPGHRVRRAAGGPEPLHRHRRRRRGSCSTGAARSSCPTTTSAARCSWRCARRRWSSARAAPVVSSVRNTWPATITGLTLLTDRVRLDLEGEPSALVDVTPAAVAELGLDAGQRVWLSAKATELEVYGQTHPAEPVAAADRLAGPESGCSGGCRGHHLSTQLAGIRPSAGRPRLMPWWPGRCGWGTCSSTGSGGRSSMPAARAAWRRCRAEGRASEATTASTATPAQTQKPAVKAASVGRPCGGACAT